MKIKQFTAFVILCFLLTYSFRTWANSTAEGYWRTYDLSQHARSIVKFTIRGATLEGVISQVLPPETNQDRCLACKGKLHNQLLVGLPIIWGLKKEGDNWVKGYVLNINNGKIYRCQVKVSNDNRILYFSAYIGMPIFGKTLNWVRV